MGKEDKTSMYLIAIVGIVAAVGIAVLLMNVGVLDLTGQAYAKATTNEKDAGLTSGVATVTAPTASTSAGTSTATCSPPNKPCWCANDACFSESTCIQTCKNKKK